MKQKLLLLLKTLFASKGFSQKALEGLADILAPNLTEESTQEEINAAIEGIAPMTAVMQAEINRQVNEAKKPKVEDPKPTDPVDPTPAPSDMPDWAKALVESNKALLQTVTEIKGEKVVNTRKAQLEAKLKDVSPAYKADKLADFELMTFKDDESFGSYLSAIEQRAADFVSQEPAFGADRPAGGAGKPAAKEKVASKESIDAIMKTI